VFLKDCADIVRHANQFGTVLCSMANEGPDPGWIQYQSKMDDDNLRTLVILHRVYGGIQVAFSCCFLAYITFISGYSGLPQPQARKRPRRSHRRDIRVHLGAVILAVLAIAGLHFLSANWIRDRRNWTGVIIVAAIDCLNVPLGIALGIFTIIVLNRPTVRITFK